MTLLRTVTTPGNSRYCPLMGPVVVAIPARDEAEGIAQTVRSVCAQVGEHGQPLPGVQVLIVANNCRDDTARQARRYALSGAAIEVIEAELAPEQANVVGARRLALDLAAERARPEGIIVSTDADTVSERDWLWQLCAPIYPGADAAAGRIVLSPRSAAALPGNVRRTARLDTAYRLAAEALTDRLNPQPHDPWPRHHQHFGACLALSVQAYRAVGGVPPVSALEDVALVRALRQHDLRLRHTPHARVYTSARTTGRVDLGLSTQLLEWRCGPEHWTVPGGAEIAALAQAEAAFREAWHGGARRDLPKRWQAAPTALDAALSEPTLGLGLEAAHAARMTQDDWHRQFVPVALPQAWQEIRALLERSPVDLNFAADD